MEGFCEVSFNRCSIWYVADMDRAGKMRFDWDQFLLEGVVAPACNELIFCLQFREEGGYH